MMRFLTAAVALLLPISAIHAGQTSPSFQVGQVYEIERIRESADKDSNGGSGSAYDRDTMAERVIAVSDAGIEFELDLSAKAKPQAREREWMVPARIFKPAQGPLQLLNRAELESRLDPWLKKANWTREICGKVIFTWNAFRIECDPGVMLKVFEHLDLDAVELREGAPWSNPMAAAPGSLKRSGTNFVVELVVDADAVRQSRARSDVGVAEIMGEKLTLEEALPKHAADKISGTITVTIETDANGRPWRRTTITKIETLSPDASTKSETINETVKRTLVQPLKLTG